MKIAKRCKAVVAGTLAVVVGFYGGVLIYYRHAEASILFSPSHAAYVLEPELQPSAQPVSLLSKDGTRLAGWVLWGDRPTRRWIYFLHGSGGNATSCQPWWSMLHTLSVNFFVLDYRGFGQSGGTPSERGIYDDARAGYDYLLEQQAARPQEIVLYGQSLGATVATELASHVPVAGVILEGAMISVPARGQELYPFLPVYLIAQNQFDALDKISAVRCAKLFLHAREDQVVPIHHGRALFERAAAPKTFVELQGGHGNAIVVDDEKARAAIRLFLEQTALGDHKSN
jgi:uncharacterized protein